jgi:hypothetical protein
MIRVDKQYYLHRCRFGDRIEVTVSMWAQELAQDSHNDTFIGVLADECHCFECYEGGHKNEIGTNMTSPKTGRLYKPRLIAL